MRSWTIHSNETRISLPDSYYRLVQPLYQLVITESDKAWMAKADGQIIS